VRAKKSKISSREKIHRKSSERGFGLLGGGDSEDRNKGAKGGGQPAAQSNRNVPSIKSLPCDQASHTKSLQMTSVTSPPDSGSN